MHMTGRPLCYLYCLNVFALYIAACVVFHDDPGDASVYQ